VLPYFKKLETYSPANGIPFEARLRGFSGPIHAQESTPSHVAGQEFLNAAAEQGIGTGDYNSIDNAFDVMQLSAFNGVRSSTRRAYLLPAMSRPNLDIVLKATVQRVLFRGNRAIGVEYEREGVVKQVFATKEVILSASAFKTPQLLMLSGIGPVNTLRSLGIPVLNHLPGVGQNLQDHVELHVYAKLKEPILTHYLTLQDIIDYDNQKAGPLTVCSAIGLGHSATFQSVSPGDIRWHMSMYSENSFAQTTRKVFPPPPIGTRYSERSTVSDDGQVRIDSLVFNNDMLHPYSRGAVTINSLNVKDPPVVDGQVLSDPRDRAAAVDMLVRCMNFTRTNAMRRLGLTSATADPDSRCAAFPPESYSFYECCAMQYTGTTWHYSGTAKMGASTDPLAVIDPRMRVYGVQGLRVVDTSVFPIVTRGNTNVPVIMAAEKAADMIKQDWGRPTQTVLLPRFDDVKLLQQTLSISALIEIASNGTAILKSDDPDAS
jgi:choline dehydrogenase